MDDVFFGVKRAHLAVNWWALLRLKEFGVTPARFDLMRMIYDRNYRWAQSALRRELGVARATISRMLIALEKLGWITREVNGTGGRGIVYSRSKGGAWWRRCCPRWFGRA